MWTKQARSFEICFPTNIEVFLPGLKKYGFIIIYDNASH